MSDSVDMSVVCRACGGPPDKGRWLVADGFVCSTCGEGRPEVLRELQATGSYVDCHGKVWPLRYLGEVSLSHTGQFLPFPAAPNPPTPETSAHSPHSRQEPTAGSEQ